MVATLSFKGQAECVVETLEIIDMFFRDFQLFQTVQFNITFAINIRPIPTAVQRSDQKNIIFHNSPVTSKIMGL